MEDRPWPAPTEYVVVARRWKYAPPPWVIFEATVDEREQWLSPLAGEAQPQVTPSRRPDAVLLSPWVDPAVRLGTIFGAALRAWVDEPRRQLPADR